ncbi:hypothetical protein M2S12_29080, partial [Klebsiella pneumoniae]|nr:hypothetical protein [Klebsiella pneumoniae]
MASFTPPLGSSDPKVLLDNASRLDKLLNGTEKTVPDRSGEPLMSWSAITEGTGEIISQAEETFHSQLNQQAHAFDAQLSGQQSRFETVMKNAGSQVLGRYEDGPWTIT